MFICPYWLLIDTNTFIIRPRIYDIALKKHFTICCFHIHAYMLLSFSSWLDTSLLHLFRSSFLKKGINFTKVSDHPYILISYSSSWVCFSYLELSLRVYSI